MEIADLIANYGFPTVMVVGLGYFVYFVYNFIQEHLDPATEKMHFQLIRVIDQMRMLDQDLIRLGVEIIGDRIKIEGSDEDDSVTI